VRACRFFVLVRKVPSWNAPFVYVFAPQSDGSGPPFCFGRERSGYFVTGNAQAESPPSLRDHDRIRSNPPQAGRGKAYKCREHVHMHHIVTSAMLKATKTFVLAPQSGGGARRAEGVLCYRQRAGGKCAPPPTLRATSPAVRGEDRYIAPSAVLRINKTFVLAPR
jgi:hypothetical protein